jgi:hypothetical protein
VSSPVTRLSSAATGIPGDSGEDAIRQEFARVLQVRTAQGGVLLGELVNGAQERKSVTALFVNHLTAIHMDTAIPARQ